MSWVLPTGSNKISQHVQIKPGSTCVHRRVSPASPPTLESVHFDVWSQSSTQEQWFDLSGRWRRRHRLSLCDSAAKVRGGAPMLRRTRRFPLSPAPELREYARQHLLPLGGPAQEKSPSPLWTPIQLDCFFVCLFHFGHTLPSQELICGLLQVTVWRWQTRPPPPVKPPPLQPPWSYGFHFPRCPRSYWHTNAINLTF